MGEVRSGRPLMYPLNLSCLLAPTRCAKGAEPDAYDTWMHERERDCLYDMSFNSSDASAEAGLGTLSPISHAGLSMST